MREAKARGWVIGSGSDRVRSDQQRLWDTHDIEMDFVGGKHNLDQVRDQFEAARYVHIGDTDVDRHFAQAAGFEFLHVDDLKGIPGAIAGDDFFDWLG
ncbi:DUF7124 domain-containing protein [Candidatus Poriferisocius sp.]|uniref:DUF7124 domain-containing protein n=1 Tax=Candidatus Poriferisocius sp. TaxID=3101276 RepID=UPI003B59DA8F